MSASDVAVRPAARGGYAQGFAFLLITSIGWGMNWPMMRVALGELPPFTIRALTSIVAFTVAFGVARLAGETLWPAPGQWGRLVVSTALNFTCFMVLSILAIAYLGPSEAVIVVFTLPLWSALLAWPLLGERLTPLRVAALALGLGGVLVLMGFDDAAPPPDYRALPGVACGLGAAVLFALGTVLSKRRPLSMPPIAAVAWQIAIGTAPLCLAALFERPDWGAVGWGGAGAFVYLALVSLVLCYITWFQALRLLPASTASIGSLLVPMVGVFGSAAMLGEPLGPRRLIALALTVSGVAMAAVRR